MGLEYELKFRATAQTLSDIGKAFAEAEQEFLMHTTYYDTPSASLSARHYTLRRRLENGKSVCTLKTPAVQGRGEWETECDDILDAVPMLCKLGAPAQLPMLVAEGLTPVCGAKFRRIAKTLVLENATVELALDSGILYSGGKELPLCEVEVELKSGEVESCNRFAKALCDRFGLEIETKSKFRRALALYRGE